MPKLKTHSSSKKRFKITATGKVKRARPFMNHILTKKSRKTKRNLRKTTVASDSNAVVIKKLLPYGR